MKLIVPLLVTVLLESAASKKDDAMALPDDHQSRELSSNTCCKIDFCQAYNMKNYYSNKYLSVEHASRNENAEIVQNPLVEGTSDNWEMKEVGYSNLYHIVNQNSGLAMWPKHDSHYYNEKIVQHTIDSSNYPQKDNWCFLHYGSNWYFIINEGNYLAMEIYAASQADGANLVQHYLDGYGRQLFKLTCAEEDLVVEVEDPDLVCYDGRLKVKVTKEDGGAPVDGQSVTVTFGGSLAPLELTANTDHNGFAHFSFVGDPNDAGQSPFEACTMSPSGDKFCQGGVVTVCKRPTASPTLRPTPQPTPAPTPRPTPAPTLRPTAAPTSAPMMMISPTVRF